MSGIKKSPQEQLEAIMFEIADEVNMIASDVEIHVVDGADMACMPLETWKDIEKLLKKWNKLSHELMDKT